MGQGVGSSRDVDSEYDRRENGEQRHGRRLVTKSHAKANVCAGVHAILRWMLQPLIHYTSRMISVQGERGTDGQ